MEHHSEFFLSFKREQGRTRLAVVRSWRLLCSLGDARALSATCALGDSSALLKSLKGLALVSISQTDVGHLMRITHCSILYRYITDVHENRTLFIEQRTERIEFRLTKQRAILEYPATSLHMPKMLL